jgi:signal recognition particle GTPase
MDLWNSSLLKDIAAEKDAVRAHQQLVFLDAVLGMGFTATAKHLVSLHGIPMCAKTRSGTSLSLQAAKAVEVWYEAVYTTR